jgi:hypothetical protein
LVDVKVFGENKKNFILREELMDRFYRGLIAGIAGGILMNNMGPYSLPLL